jgi:hypothetical protein
LRFDLLNEAAASTRPLACLEPGAYLVSFGETHRLTSRAIKRYQAENQAWLRLLNN